MPAARYWRIVAIDTYAGADLELSALHLYGGAARLDAAATISSTFAPVAGTLAALQDDDLATTCRFAGDAVRSGGFAIVWDFGAGNAADVIDLLLGAATNRGDFLAGCTLQYSDNGTLWQVRRALVADWPVAGAHNSVNAVEGDLHFEKVSLLLHMDGENNSTTFTDSSATPKVVSTFSNAKISTAQSKFGGASAALTGGSIGYSSSADFGFGTGDFTVEGYIRATQSDMVFLDLRTDGTQAGVFTVNQSNQGNGIGYYQPSTGVLGGSTATNDGNWHHYAWTRESGVFRMFSDGVKVYEGALASDFGSARPCWVGSQFGGTLVLYTGNFDDLRITKGVARYTDNFTPPNTPAADAPIGRGHASEPDGAHIAASAEAPAFSAPLPSTVATARDVEHGGAGTVFGTVDRKGTPTNVPLRRRVRLLSDASGNMVRETWSDATTGAFAFSGIDPAQRYTTLVYDYEHNFRAEAADNLTPEVPT